MAHSRTGVFKLWSAGQRGYTKGMAGVRESILTIFAPCRDTLSCLCIVLYYIVGYDYELWKINIPSSLSCRKCGRGQNIYSLLFWVDFKWQILLFKYRSPRAMLSKIGIPGPKSLKIPCSRTQLSKKGSEWNSNLQNQFHLRFCK